MFVELWYMCDEKKDCSFINEILQCDRIIKREIKSGDRNYFSVSIITNGKSGFKVDVVSTAFSDSGCIGINYFSDKGDFLGDIFVDSITNSLPTNFRFDKRPYTELSEYSREKELDVHAMKGTINER